METLNHRGINFIRSSVREASNYREDHRGIPFRIVLFMTLVRAAAFYMVCIPPIAAMVGLGVHDYAGLWWFGTSVWYGISTNSRFDVFTPLGFRLFKILITRRG